jgi:perosamine synthetase
VHAFGLPADMASLCPAARGRGITVIEDACEAVGGKYYDRSLGAIGDAGVFAFYPNKQMTTGEGGLIVTDNEEWAALFRSLRNQGRDGSDVWLSHSRLGFNYRMDELSAALGLAQLRRIDTLLEKRRKVANWYTERLAMVEGVSVPKAPASATQASWFAYVVRLADDGNRGAVMEHLEKAGVPSRPYFQPIHLQSFYRERFGWQEGAFPVAERLGRCSLALPFSSVMTEDQVDYVCSELVAWL